LEGSKLWSHEDYAIAGKVENVLLRSEDRRKLLVSVRPEGSDKVLPVVFEQKDNDRLPVQREQQLLLRVTLGPAEEILCTAHE
jgi:hypothetical protein